MTRASKLGAFLACEKMLEAGRGQVSNYEGEILEEVWEDGPL